MYHVSSRPSTTQKGFCFHAEDNPQSTARCKARRIKDELGINVLYNFPGKRARRTQESNRFDIFIT